MYDFKAEKQAVIGILTEIARAPSGEADQAVGTSGAK